MNPKHCRVVFVKPAANGHHSMSKLLPWYLHTVRKYVSPRVTVWMRPETLWTCLNVAPNKPPPPLASPKRLTRHRQMVSFSTSLQKKIQLLSFITQLSPKILHFSTILDGKKSFLQLFQVRRIDTYIQTHMIFLTPSQPRRSHQDENKSEGTLPFHWSRFSSVWNQQSRRLGWGLWGSWRNTDRRWQEIHAGPWGRGFQNRGTCNVTAAPRSNRHENNWENYEKCLVPIQQQKSDDNDDNTITMWLPKRHYEKKINTKNTTNMWFFSLKKKGINQMWQYTRGCGDCLSHPLSSSLCNNKVQSVNSLASKPASQSVCPSVPK